MSESSNSQIEEKISKSSRGELFFAEDFAKFGSPGNVRLVLFRLEKEGILERIAQGIYLKPKKDSVLGVLHPSIEEIAEKIAKRDKARIAPTGVMALYLLGLTTQIPLKVAYLTDGSQRKVKIGNHTIQFKRTVPKSFAIKDRLLHLIVQAFRERGQKNITAEFLEQIEPSVKKLEIEVIEKQLRYAPVWIQKKIQKLYNRVDNVD